MTPVREHGKRSYIALSGNKIGVVLTKGYVATIDPEDFAEISKHSWHAKVKPSGKVYAARSGTGVVIKMHRQLMGNPEGGIDHIDGNGLNNCRANLRLATHAQNQHNRPPNRVKRYSPYKGVNRINRPRRDGKIWLALIYHNNTRTVIGHYHCDVEAAKAYDKAALQYHGEFAYQNFPANIEQEKR